jgi:predicted ATPase
MNTTVEISGQELHVLLDKAAGYLQAATNEPFALETDYYALIPTPEWETLENAQTVIGSLFDDVAELKRVAKGRIPFSSVDLDRLASVLRAVSQLLNPV